MTMNTPIHMQEKPCICIGLRRVAQKVTDLYDKALEPAGISINQYSLLKNIRRMEGCGTGELAQKVRLEKSTLVRTLQPLLRDGLIEDRSSGENRRRRLHLTPLGEKTFQQATPLWAQVQEELAGQLGRKYDALMEIFQQLDV